MAAAADGRESLLWKADFDNASRVEPGDDVYVLGANGTRIYGVAQWLDIAPPREGAKQWKDGRSAKELARAWFRQPVAAVPEELRQLFETNAATRGLHVATALAEWTTTLGDDDEREGRNHDLLLLGTVGQRRVVVGIEAKADEEFGPRVEDRLNAAAAKNAEPGRSRTSIVPERIDRLCQMLFGRAPDDLGALRYQLLHALAGTILEAQRRDAALAVFVVHEFVGHSCRTAALDRNHRDLERFVAALSPESLPQLQAEHLVGPIHLPAGGDDEVDIFIGKATTNVDLSAITGARHGG